MLALALSLHDSLVTCSLKSDVLLHCDLDALFMSLYHQRHV